MSVSPEFPYTELRTNVFEYWSVCASTKYFGLSCRVNKHISNSERPTGNSNLLRKTTAAGSKAVFQLQLLFSIKVLNEFKIIYVFCLCKKYRKNFKQSRKNASKL